MADATQVQRRRGTQSQCEAGTPVEGEIWVDTTFDTLRVGDGSKAGGFLMPNAEHIQESTFNYASAVGSDSLSVTLFPVPDNPSTGFSFKFRAAENNTGSVDIAVNGQSPVEIRKIQGNSIVSLDPNDLITDGIYEVTHNGTYYLLGYTIPVIRNDYEFLGSFDATGSFRYWQFLNIFENNYSYDIEIYDLGHNGSTSEPVLQFSSNGGTTWTQSVTNYNSQGASTTNLLRLSQLGSSASRLSTKLSFINPNSNSNITRVHCCEYSGSSNGNGKISQPFFVNSSFDSFRIDINSGVNIVSGVCKIWRKRAS